LSNARPDADAIATSLERLGFSVTKVTDANLDNFRRAVLSFHSAAQTADMAVLYYAGHGLEINGENWLIPVDAELKSDVDADNEAISLRYVMLAVSNAKGLGLVILDACRQNPFAVKMRRSTQAHSNARGLARVEPANSILVAFAAKDGTTAEDGSGAHSPFTRALLDNIEISGLEINFMFRNIRDDVLEETHQAQEPFLYGSLSKDEVYFKPLADIHDADNLGTETPADEIAWSYLQYSIERATLQNFIDEFPFSAHIAEARQRVALLEAPRVATDSPPDVLPQADELSWSLLSESTNLNSLHQFIDQFPTSRYVAAARARIEGFEALASQPDLGSLTSKSSDRSTGGPPNVVSHASAGPTVSTNKGVARRIRRMTPEVERAWKVIKDTHDTATLLAFSEDFPTRHHKTIVRQKLSGLVGASPTPGGRHLDDEYYVRECDRLAADPRDRSRPSSILGIEYNRLDARHAATVCHQAVLRHPSLARLKFQLCRCLVKLGDASRASEECLGAVRLSNAKNDGSAKLYSATSQAIRPLLTPTGAVSLPAGTANEMVSPETNPPSASLQGHAPVKDIYYNYTREGDGSDTQTQQGQSGTSGSRGESLPKNQTIARKPEPQIDAKASRRPHGGTSDGMAHSIGKKSQGMHQKFSNTGLTSKPPSSNLVGRSQNSNQMGRSMEPRLSTKRSDAGTERVHGSSRHDVPTSASSKLNVTHGMSVPAANTKVPITKLNTPASVTHGMSVPAVNVRVPTTKVPTTNIRIPNVNIRIR
jgi:hypothetical protein